MTGRADWDRDNEAYLTAALRWLRLRLLRLADQDGPAPAASTETALVPASTVPPSTVPPLIGSPPIGPAESRWRLRRSARAADPAGPEARQIVDVTPGAVGADDLQQAAEAMTAAAATTPPPALVALAQRFGMTGFERDLLLFCVAMELDAGLPPLYAGAHGDPAAGYPTFALGLALFDDPTWEALLPDRPLRHFGLVEIHQSGATPLVTSPLRVDERVAGYVKGVTYVDDRLAPLLTPVAPVDPALRPPPSSALVVEQVVAQLQGAAQDGGLPVVQLLGADPAGKETVAAHVADSLGLHLFRMPAQLLAGDVGELERFSRLWQRECVLVPIALLLDAGPDASPPGSGSSVSHFLSRGGGLMLVDTPSVVALNGRPTLVVDVGRPTAGEQADLWRAGLGAEAGAAPERLAAQFDLGGPVIARIAAAARLGPDPAPLADRAWRLGLVETRDGLDALAQRIEPKATWDDIVLPEPELDLLRMIADQVGRRGAVHDRGGFAERTSRGLGVNALFAGPSGTGKTMAAEVIANHLRLNLYRIDLSSVVSKYIGETERNLERLFTRAESGGVILFFDEADALFGKRTEIRDSHDRYANIEVSYLLQRMESYRGLAILATNARGSMDAAFVRRLRFVVTFPHPRVEERKRIWQHVFPAATRTHALDYDRLARFTFAGGNIFSIALNAAYLAAAEDSPVTMAHVLRSARVETRKLERPLNEREYDPADRRVTA